MGGKRTRSKRGVDQDTNPGVSFTPENSDSSNMEKRLKAAYNLLTKAYRGELGEMATVFLKSLPPLTPPATIEQEKSTPTTTVASTITSSNTVDTPTTGSTTTTDVSTITPPTPSPPGPVPTPPLPTPTVPTPPLPTPSLPNPPVPTLPLIIHPFNSYPYNQQHQDVMFHPPPGPTHYPAHPQMGWGCQQLPPSAYYPVPRNQQPPKYYQNITDDSQVNQAQAWKQFVETKYKANPDMSKNDVKKFWNLKWFMKNRGKYYNY